MSDDLVNELLNLGPDDSGFREVGVAAATALSEARAEIEAANYAHARMRDRAHAAESELSTLRARVREVVGPFARADAAIGSERGPFRFETGTGYRLIEREDLRAARQLNEDLK